MLTFRRALITAAVFLAFLYLLSRSGSDPSSISPSSDDLEAITSKDNRPSKSDSVHETPSSTSKPENGSKQNVHHDASHQALVDALAYQFPYDVESKFPAYIWQTWKYTPASGEFGDLFRPAEASWTALHPGFIHEVITDEVAVHLMRHLYASIPEVLEAYSALPMPILKADFFRYLILLARGGIYSDIDTYALKSALEWIPENVPRSSLGLVIGIEADPDRPDWKEWYSRRIQFCQWTIQSKPGHPVLREIVAHITRETLRRRKDGTLKDLGDERVIEFTGPAVWTDIIFDFFNNPRYFDMENSERHISWEDFTGMTSPRKVGDVIVLPITSFSPGVQQMGAGDYEHPMAFVRHEFEGTWKPEHLRHIGEVVEGQLPQADEAAKKANEG